MTEKDWLECEDPKPMLEFLAGKASERKLRLFACGCCRHIWNLLLEIESKQSIEEAERYAEGMGSKAQLLRAHHYALTSEVWGWEPEATSDTAAFIASAHPDALDSEYVADLAVNPPTVGLPFMIQLASDVAIWSAKATVQHDVPLSQAQLLREIFNNRITLDPAWITPTVLSLAQASYDQRNLPSGTLDNDRLAILADALEDAGCDNQDILAHCRQPGVHVRGCWVVDLLLGKR